MKIIINTVHPPHSPSSAPLQCLLLLVAYYIVFLPSSYHCFPSEQLLVGFAPLLSPHGLLTLSPVPAPALVPSGLLGAEFCHIHVPKAELHPCHILSIILCSSLLNSLGHVVSSCLRSFCVHPARSPLRTMYSDT